MQSFLSWLTVSFDSIIEASNNFLYQSSENWYIGLILLKSLRTKKRTAARFPQLRKPSRVSSILFMFVSALSSSVLTLSEVSFDCCSWITSSSSSRRLIFSSLRRARIESSSARISAFPFVIAVSFSFFWISSYGCSHFTTIYRHYSSRPDSFTIKLTTFTLVEISGV